MRRWSEYTKQDKAILMCLIGLLLLSVVGIVRQQQFNQLVKQQGEVLELLKGFNELGESNAERITELEEKQITVKKAPAIHYQIRCDDPGYTVGPCVEDEE